MTGSEGEKSPWGRHVCFISKVGITHNSGTLGRPVVGSAFFKSVRCSYIQIDIRQTTCFRHASKASDNCVLMCIDGTFFLTSLIQHRYKIVATQRQGGRKEGKEGRGRGGNGRTKGRGRQERRQGVGDRERVRKEQQQKQNLLYSECHNGNSLCKVRKKTQM